MVARRDTWLIVLALAAAAGLAYWWLRPGDEARIRHDFRALEGCLHKGAKDGTASLVLRTQSIQGLLARTCDFAVPRYQLEETLSPPEVARELARAQVSLTTLTVSFTDVRLQTLAASEAVATCTVRAIANGDAGAMAESAELSVRLVKEDGHWRFAAFSEGEVLTK